MSGENSAHSELVASASASSVFTEPLAAIRDSVKWVMTATAAVAGALVAGLQLTAIGRMEYCWLFVAATAYIGAVSALGIILHKAAAVLLMPALTLSDLSERYVRAQQRVVSPSTEMDSVAAPDPNAADPLLAALSKRRGVLLPGPRLDVQKLYHEFKELTASQQIRTLSVRNSIRLQTIQQQATQLTRAANLYQAQAQYLRLRKTLGIAGSVVTLMVLAFAVSVGHQRPAVPAVTTPMPVSVVLTGSDDALRNADVPLDCPRIIAGMAIGGTFADPTVVTQPGYPRCPPMELHVTNDVGVAVPMPGASRANP
ncbi:hypothetical protein Ahu01nite_002420 [Winogradskya humida]|uniref:Uncharacterized protein n=1 Tax=Winogradskya humida TaxID=113566 RepID=A0ABQ3ZEZ8_9ACTN|nr:hypothetical protein Ahu01nite_002420 [Actinoplanes humidus]